MLVHRRQPAYGYENFISMNLKFMKNYLHYEDQPLINIIIDTE